MKLKKIKRAIISVSDKSNLKLILPSLKKYNIEILSTGGTFNKIKSMNYKCKEISNYTDFDQMLDGRVKTLHPLIHAGILAKKNSPAHLKQIKKIGLEPIDLVVTNLYPFEKIPSDPKSTEAHCIENIDMWGHLFSSRLDDTPGCELKNQYLE